MTATYTLVTGASSGIGLAFATEFAQQKHNLILVARREHILQKIAQELETKDVSVEVVPADLAATGGAEALFREVESRGLQVDILVNNAGRGNTSKFCEQNVQHMRGTQELNMISLTLLSRLFISKMEANGYGRVINVASTAAFMPAPGFAVYHASKAYVLSLSEALNIELKGTGVSVTASCPGLTESEFHVHADFVNVKGFDKIPQMPARQVAQEAYAAMMAGRSLVLHGYLNKALATLPKLIPRRWVPYLVKAYLT